MAEIPIAEGLFTWPSTNPALIGGRCESCGCIDFPCKSNCPRCGSSEVKAKSLHRRGSLWSWTIQAFPAVSPPYTGLNSGSEFKSFGVGYIELPDQVCVESPLMVSDPELLRIGMEMDLVITPHGINDRGDQVMAFAFRPTEIQGG